MQKLIASSRYPGEIAVLLALMAVLPVLEAPKNIFLVIYLVTWLVNRWRAADFGGSWDVWDSLIALWIASGYIVASFAGFHHDEWSGPHDIARYGLLLWTLKRSGYGRSEIQLILGAVGIVCAIALIFALWAQFVTHSRKALELNSVGHVNHSAIYLLISFGTTLSLALAFWHRLNPVTRITAALICLFLAAGVVMSASRAAVGVLPLLSLILAFVWCRRSCKPFVILAVLCAVIGAGAYVARLEVVQKQQGNMESNNVLSYRDQIWNVALVAWRQYPIFGVGMNNFNQISDNSVKRWVEASGKTYDASRYKGTAHAHSLYLNTLAERGAFGLGVVMLVLLAWFWRIVRHIPKREDEDITWALWGGNFTAWFATVGVGLVNTTLHHENAILVALLLGPLLAFNARNEAAFTKEALAAEASIA
ncbi:MAG: O-antigen ligase family protein [Pseudomonadota bacterium]